MSIPVDGQDLSEPGRRERELAELAKLRAVVDAFPDIYICFDAEGLIVDYYSAPGRVVQVPRGELVGRSIREIVPAPVAIQALEALRGAAESGKSAVMTYELPLPSGSRWYEGRIVPLPPAQAMAVVRDVTDRVRAAEEVLRSREQYRALVDNLTAKDNLIAEVVAGM